MNRNLCEFNGIPSERIVVVDKLFLPTLQKAKIFSLSENNVGNLAILIQFNRQFHNVLST
jgi:hypothetical protein